MKSSAIRKQFLDFFASKNHQIVPSSPMVLKNDPTLMFTNSGMVPFKDFFLGYQTSKNPRISDTQKCLRVSGKHNDLDDVGKDTYHHTMFEMLGNWSIGDYFKEEAIAWAWELLTEIYKIPKENLYVTVFEGDKSDNLTKDEEAYNIWKKYIAEDRILNGNKKDNFWEMGEQGPCGPCSEIHVDIRSAEEKAQKDGKELINEDHPQVVEIWNLVFMQYLRKANGSLETLPAQHVDTGMGFERLCMVLQNKTSNYDTDVFQPLIKKVETLSGIIYGTNQTTDIAIRVVVDHIRAVAFSIADGQIPSNSGAGYVIRRILRRAVSYGFRNLNLKEPFIYKLVAILTQEMKDSFPELEQQQKLITKVIEQEEKSFLKTIAQGLDRLDAIISQQKDTKVIDGKLVYELHDTFGFPSDLSRIIAEEKGFSIDEIGYEKEQKRLKNISKKASESKTSDWNILLENALNNPLQHSVLQADIKINRYREIETPKGKLYQLVFNQTPFYAEGGGQVGDKGYIENNDEKIEILNTKKETGLVYHMVKKLPKNLTADFTAQVNQKLRKNTTFNHSATHLLHKTLRDVLGTHVEQKGSFVGPDYLRFDFSHFSKITEEELALIESQVNQAIRKGIPLQEFNNITMDEALEKGAMALFGEKYGDTVRMIQFGESKELCGGCHVQNTSEIVLFKIQSESSAAAGIRRIEAITGEAVLSYYSEIENEYSAIKSLLKNPKNMVETISLQQEEIQDYKKQIEVFNTEKAQSEKQIWKNTMTEKGGKHYIFVQSSLSNTYIKDIIFQLKSEIENLLIVVASDYNQKPLLSIGVSKAIVADELHAGNLVKELAKEIQGGGGGQPEFATAGGKNIAGLPKVLEIIKERFL